MVVDAVKNGDKFSKEGHYYCTDCSLLFMLYRFLGEWEEDPDDLCGDVILCEQQVVLNRESLLSDC